jgi:hypothetical protein
VSPPTMYAATPAHRRPVSANAAYAAATDSASAAIRRAGYQPTPGNIRMVLRAWRDSGELPITNFEWWDRLVRGCPMRGRRKLRASDPRRDGWRQR